MTALGTKLQTSAIHARVVPYVLIVVFTVIQDSFEGPARYWLYLAKMLLGLWCIWEMRSLVPEMRWAVSWEAIVTGILVFLIWVFLDPFYPKFGLLFKEGAPWNPFKMFGPSSALGWFFILVRTLGSALIVPPIEESFYRSFLYRYFVRLDFTSMPFNRFHWLSLIVTSLLFGLAHYQWLAGVLCGLFFQALVIRKNRLGDAMAAHAITNFLLGVWVVWQDAWIFW
jgi:CAAX prenyl protease-like protein